MGIDYTIVVSHGNRYNPTRITYSLREAIETDMELPYEVWKEFILERDNYTCVECGKSQDQMSAHIQIISHHKLFARDGGKYIMSNGEARCWKCHRRKHSETPALPELVLYQYNGRDYWMKPR